MGINWYLLIYIFFILLSCKLNPVYSIQCCVDRTCSEKTIVDCPKNVCFKLDMQVPGGKQSEDRGCMGDLISFLLPKKTDAQNSNDDSCQKTDPAAGGFILCQCTSNLCNSSSKNSYIAYPILILILFVIYQYSFVFR